MNEKPGICRFVEQNIWKYIDRELSAKRVGEISTHLKACAGCTSLYETRVKEARLYRNAFASSPFNADFCDRMEERLIQEFADQLPPDAAADTFTFQPRRRGRSLAVSFAVAVAAVVVLGLFLTRGPNGLSGPEPGTDGVSDAGPGRVLPIGSRKDPVVGQIVETGWDILSGRNYHHLDERGDESRLLRLIDDGTYLKFLAGTSVSFRVFDTSMPGGRFEAEIEVGDLDVKVTPRRRSDPFILWTAHARVEVLGTQFRLRVGAESTELTVLSGEVRFTEIRDGEEFGVPRLVVRETGLARFPSTPAQSAEQPEDSGSDSQAESPSASGASQPSSATPLDGTRSIKNR